MSNIIQLLPDSIANQIAAGEVVQRPASVLKELLENSIDAESTRIKVIVKDSGKTLIQVIDDGLGMNDTDARMCFERHATSKIKSANDLFKIKTMGFRGEAMASIAAIAHVELQTQQRDLEVGTKIIIKGSTVEKQEPVSISYGTNISVKNLFYNIPARRKFLKSDPVEFKHLLEEFHRVALSHPEVFFSLHHNGNEVYHLPASNLRQRVVNTFGKNLNEKIVPVNEQMELINIFGFIGKPEAAKKTKGDQYIFVNNRYIKSHYLNHAIRSAYEEMVPKEYYPLYFIKIDIDPMQIDINVHPTKTEIKFEDERLIYNYVRVAIKHSLGKYTLAPTLDFENANNFERMASSQAAQNRQGGVRIPKQNSSENWDQIYQALQAESTGSKEAIIIESEASKIGFDDPSFQSAAIKKPYQIHESYIVNQIKSGFILIDQGAAHERILYERYYKAMLNKEPLSQKQLFPKTIELNVAQKAIIDEILPQFNCLGFEIEDFGNNSLIVHGIPVGLAPSTDIQELIEQIIVRYEEHHELEIGIEENLARAMARSSSKKKKQRLTEEEMSVLIDELFACDISTTSPSGQKCYVSFELDELKQRFLS